MEQKKYYSLNEYYHKIFHTKAYKISLNAGFTCPNRDGTLDYRGCIFCSEGGAGDFAAPENMNLTDQISSAIKTVSGKYAGNCFVAYFQAFTNTYAPVSALENIFLQAINDSRISGISIATRPDCLDDEKIQLLASLSKIKPIWIELGLQTINETTATYIRRGYPLAVFDETVCKLHLAGLPVVAHMIIGLPGETHEDYLSTAKYIAKLNIGGIKLQLLHVLKGTDLETDYANGVFQVLSLNEYIKEVADIIAILPPDMVIHRITGDGPKNILVAPLWSSNKKMVLNALNKEFISRKTFQGKDYHSWLSK